jgi:predicted translin family RNA/ssDNA-binding protein
MDELRRKNDKQVEKALKLLEDIDERICKLERIMNGEQINGDFIEGVFSKVKKMWEQFTFMSRIYKVIMYFTGVLVIGLIGVFIKLFTGGK